MLRIRMKQTGLVDGYIVVWTAECSCGEWVAQDTFHRTWEGAWRVRGGKWRLRAGQLADRGRAHLIAAHTPKPANQDMWTIPFDHPDFRLWT